MQSNNIDLKKISHRLLLARTSLLIHNPFFGLLLMHLPFGLDNSIDTAYTDGKKICFSPKFVSMLNDKELEFICLHEVMHIVLRHCTRLVDKDDDLANIACDIVVNSNILYSNSMDINSISTSKYGVSMHLTPNKDEGYKYSAEEVYEMLLKKLKKGKSSFSSNLKSILKKSIDTHDKWGQIEKPDMFNEIWKNRILNAMNSTHPGNLPLLIQREINELRNPKLNWRIILNNFVEDEINDYSFTPPDRRFDDSPFFLPDFNEKDEKVKNILFMIDTSGSMSKEDISEMFSEIKGAIDQFNGKLEGYLGFFDATVTKPISFSNINEFKVIKAFGGGGTSYEPIFDYVNNEMKDNPPSRIIILTDGYAPFPEEEVRNNIPVLWIINNDQSETPPWGKVIRI